VLRKPSKSWTTCPTDENPASTSCRQTPELVPEPLEETRVDELDLLAGAAADDSTVHGLHEVDEILVAMGRIEAVGHRSPPGDLKS
jgi:hypothetical protein